MADCNDMGFHTQIASVMEVLANAAVAEICKLVDDDYAVFRLEISQSQKENSGLRRKLQLLELKVAREHRPSSVKILDRFKTGLARGEGHLTGGHRSFVKPAGHNTWNDDQPITVDEPADAGPGFKLERSEGDEDPRHSRNIQTGVKDPTTDAAQPRTQRSITEVSGTLNAVVKSKTDTKTLTVTHSLLHTGPDQISDPGLGTLGCPPAPGSDYLPVFHQSQRPVHSRGDGDCDMLDTGGDDPACSYTTEKDPGNIPLGLETQTDLSIGDWNQYSSSVYSEGYLDKKGEGLVINEVTVKLEGDVPSTWNTDNHLGEGHSQGRDFLDYRESLETNPNVATHSPLHTLRDRDPVSTSMGSSDSHGHVFFDQVLNSNNRARAQARGGVAASGNSKEKRFLCMFCNKGFSCPQNVAIHQRVHTGEKPFSCTQCHMRFTEAGTLKRHQRVHTGEKPYSCPQCEKRFSRQDKLKSHLKVHTGERPFTCTHCGKRFSERSYLRIHQEKTHSTL
ncbi:zinc finger protein 41-like isoform X2 [Oncorhynchus kisutch]|uniref:zinc finger protein 41-like isoform X2 n=1 Tax=Oncorhynchus kisutch TaxID=8019 RepID=UPI0009A0055B|nr:zinc finger protein 41-like isoform X2 [Oncorhynchus kisutch]